MKKMHTGACHCGAVKVRAEVDTEAATRCNCSICTKHGLTSARVSPPAALTIEAADGALGTYRFGVVCSHHFCVRCGVYVVCRGNLPELGGEFASVNVNVLDGADPARLTVRYWDGRHDNWHAGLRDAPWPVDAA